MRTPPTAIGGVGGSGTRVVASVLRDLGYYMGTDLNDAHDNLAFTLLFVHQGIVNSTKEEFAELSTIFTTSMAGTRDLTFKERELVRTMTRKDRLGPQRGLLVNIARRVLNSTGTPIWLKQRYRNLLQVEQRIDAFANWGWKEPNTHIVMDRLLEVYPDMKYIHVVRNGLDMAFSNNQNQFGFWGEYVLKTSFKMTPHWSLRFWCEANRRIFDVCSMMGERFLLVRFDDLCSDPVNQLAKLTKFLDVEVCDSKLKDLSGTIHMPKTIGRFREHDISMLDARDVDYVKEMGFTVQ